MYCWEGRRALQCSAGKKDVLENVMLIEVALSELDRLIVYTGSKSVWNGWSTQSKGQNPRQNKWNSRHQRLAQSASCHNQFSFLGLTNYRLFTVSDAILNPFLRKSLNVAEHRKTYQDRKTLRIATLTPVVGSFPLIMRSRKPVAFPHI